jgi:hypothetical protein
MTTYGSQNPSDPQSWVPAVSFSSQLNPFNFPCGVVTRVAEPEKSIYYLPVIYGYRDPEYDPQVTPEMHASQIPFATDAWQAKLGSYYCYEKKRYLLESPPADQIDVYTKPSLEQYVTDANGVKKHKMWYTYLFVDTCQACQSGDLDDATVQPTAGEGETMHTDISVPGSDGFDAGPGIGPGTNPNGSTNPSGPTTHTPPTPEQIECATLAYTNANCSTPGTDTGGEGSGSAADACKDNPARAGCTPIGDPAALPQSIGSRVFNISAQSSPWNFGGAASCPATQSFVIAGHQIPAIDYSNICPLLAGPVRAVVLLMAALGALFIVLPRSET